MAAPCFLVFLTDQLRADHVGFGGNVDVRTPVLDRLAGESMVFDRNYVAAPICMPNRATIATGRWPSVHGTRTNGITLDPDAQTVFSALRSAGWDTVAIGKLHFQPMGWDFEPHQQGEMAERAPIVVDRSTPDAAPRPRGPGWDRFEEAARHRAQHVPLPAGYYGFERVDLTVGHSDRATGHYTHWARERGLDPDAVSGWERASERYERWSEVYRTEVPAELYPTTYIAERTIAHLERLAAGDRPFVIFCSFPDPHHPFSPPAGYWGMYEPGALRIPETFGDAHRASPPHVCAMLARRGTPDEDPTMTWAPDEAQLRQALAAEYGMITMIDESIGRILDAVDRLGLAERTTTVFTADHGDLFGEHGLMLKHFVHYDGVLRIPLAVRVPGGATGRVGSLTSSADLAPTLLDLAGVAPYRGIQGLSLRPLLEERATALRSGLLVEEDQPFGVDGLPGPVRMRTLVTEDARLTLYADRPFGELFDRASDPHELENLYDRADGVPLRARLTEQLARELMDVADTGVRPAAAA